jgi:hypothetical protein
MEAGVTRSSIVILKGAQHEPNGKDEKSDCPL